MYARGLESLRSLPTKKAAQPFEGSETFRKASSDAFESQTAEHLKS